VNVLIERLGRSASPPWVGPAMLGVSVVGGLLALVIEGGPYDPGGAFGYITPLSVAMVGLYMLAWLWELLGPARPRWLFALLALGPASVLLYGGRDTLAPLLCMIVAGWLAYTGTRQEGLVGLGLVLLSFVPTFAAGHGEYDNWFTWSLGSAICSAMGRLLALQQRTVAALRATQLDLAHQAAAEERRRLAREIHDLVAHTLAVTMLHLTGARHVLERDPARAAEALAQAEELGRQSLADLRRAVGLLADGGLDGSAPRTHGAQEIPALAAEFAQAGMSLQSAFHGRLDVVPPELGSDLYRMAQESLANAAKHALGQPVQLDLVVAEHTVRLLVRNSVKDVGSRGSSSDARGLAGLQARVARHCGEIMAGYDGLTWRVMIQLPLSPVRAEAEERLS